MQWGAEADLLLFKHLLKTHDVKVDYKVLAEAMGNGITPKAITHRIGKIRSLPTPNGDGTTAANPTPTKAKNSPKKPATPRGAAKTAASGSTTKKVAVRGKGKKRGAAAVTEEETDEGSEFQEDEGSPKSNAKKIKLGEKLESSNEENSQNEEAEI